MFWLNQLKPSLNTEQFVPFSQTFDLKKYKGSSVKKIFYPRRVYESVEPILFYISKIDRKQN